MNTEIVPPIKRRRGRPRKKNANMTAINKFPTFTPQTSYKRKSAPDPNFSSSDPPEIEILSLNGDLDDPSKKPRLDDSDQPKRLQPPRRARFTESYGGTADVVLVEESDDSESESDSDCEPVPSPVLKVRTKEELEAHDENIQVLRKSLNDEEMKLVLLIKLRDSQRASGKRSESNSSPLPTSLVGGQQKQPSKSGVQLQPLPSKQLLTNKYIANKRDHKSDVTSNSSSSLLKTSSSSQFKPIHSSFKAHPQQPYNKPVKQESSSMEQLNSNHLNQYPLLKNLSNQITITAVPPPTTSSNGNNIRHHHHQQQQQQQQQQQLQDEKNDEETLQQRQAAAKLALRKQLEKTLLQIPLPKPPPLKINFYPSANSMEYLCLLGLDFVVDFLTRSKRHHGPSDTKDPLRCAQCETDFTCAWKWKEVEKGDGRKTLDVFCEACITSNVRRALKAQHTNNLKSAFLKALQQEKEIDRLTIHTMPKATTTTPKSSSMTPKSSSSSSRDLMTQKSSSSSRDLQSSKYPMPPQQQHHHHHQHHRESTPKSATVRDTLKSNRHHARQHHPDSQSGHSSGNRGQPSPAHQGSSSAFSIPKQGMAMPYIPKSSQGINHAALAQLSKLSPQYQSLLQAQAQQLLAAGVPLHPGVLSLPPFMTGPHLGGAPQRSREKGGERRERHRNQSPNIPHTSSSSWKA